jgi:hypothetical protein
MHQGLPDAMQQKSNSPTMKGRFQMNAIGAFAKSHQFAVKRLSAFWATGELQPPNLIDAAIAYVETGFLALHRVTATKADPGEKQVEKVISRQKQCCGEVHLRGLRKNTFSKQSP